MKQGGRNRPRNFAVCEEVKQPGTNRPDSPLLSSSAGGEAGEDISGCSGSLHLVFSRIWFSKYEPIH